MGINAVDTIKKYNLKLTKTLGQNFLRDNNIVKKIAEAAEITKDDAVIEVGPGIGTLTCELAQRAGQVVAVEIDKRLITPLSENLKGFSNVHIINKDILKMDIEQEINLILKAELFVTKTRPVKVVANLPYYITTPVIMKFLEEGPLADIMVFMVQKEVADRIVAKPGGKDYGALSVAVQYYSKPERMFNVLSGCFIPRPDVDSTVIRLRVNKNPPVELMDKKMFFQTVRACFGQRRKTLLNALHNSGYYKLDKEEIREVLVNTGINPESRGETLSILQFAQLSNAFFQKDC
ncbi:MAG: 16S rRNA (adenine(1518)-N(6)/adenine(1519)-N(6))-dimethyltransferase RsmA [Acetivibrionales bacterium]|jgi:16S rRNA (adenine1518-N6/adenine1519-N6)-dimethyltransferase